MQLSDVAMVILVLAFTMYVVLDGYDLGIGMLTLVDRDDERRRSTFELVARAWDGNESWLVLIGLSLWAAVPLAFGAALPALYVVLVPMLFALILRGVSIELIAQAPGWHPVWGRIFGIGSAVAAFCQGAAFGGLLAGIPTQDGTFTGGPFTFLHDGYAILTGITAIALYVAAAAAWIAYNARGDLRAWAASVGRRALAALGVGTIACWALLAAVGDLPLRFGAAARLPLWLIGAVLLVVGFAVSLRAYSHLSNDGADRRPLWGALTIYAGGLTVALALHYPTLVSPSIDVHAAASPHSSLLFFVIGIGMFIPVILAYQTYGYWVFRGPLVTDREDSVPVS